MSLTYPHDRPLPHDPVAPAAREEPYVPVYARTRRTTTGRSRDGVRAWMILAPIGVLVLGGAAAALMFGGGEDAAPVPLAEPAATAPVLPAQPLASAVVPVQVEPIEAVPAPAPVVRRAAPAPVRRRAATPAPAATAEPATPRVVVEAEPTAPQAYTSTLNTAPAAEAPAPVIVIQPAD